MHYLDTKHSTLPNEGVVITVLSSYHLSWSERMLVTFVLYSQSNQVTLTVEIQIAYIAWIDLIQIQCMAQHRSTQYTHTVQSNLIQTFDDITVEFLNSRVRSSHLWVIRNHSERFHSSLVIPLFIINKNYIFPAI